MADQPNIIPSIPIDLPVLVQIGEIADVQHTEAYVVGGYVRDQLLGRNVTDIDIVVVGDGIAFARTIANAFGRTNLVIYEAFGTALLPLDNVKIEFVGARCESYRKDSRKPAVATGTLQDDLSRRDFTVNAIAVSLNTPTFGTIVDPFGGREDLSRKLLRTPLEPVATFDDDPLRILRAMRFSAQLGFDVEPQVLDAARSMATRLSIVSQERITDEILKTMKSPRPSVGLQLMFDTGVLQVVFPEIAQMAGVDQRKDHHHKDVFRHTLQVLDKVADVSDNVWLRFAALLHDVGKPKTKAFIEGTGWTFHGHEEFGARMVKPIFRRMKLSLDHVKFVEKIVRLHLRPMALVDEGVTDSAVRRLLFDSGADVDDLMTLCRADITSKNPRLVEQVRSNYEFVSQRMAEIEEKDRIRNWQPPLRGEDIIELCGIEPGPMVGVLKDMVVDAILDGKIPNEYDSAKTYLLQIKDEILQKPASKRPRRTDLGVLGNSQDSEPTTV